MDEKRNYDKLLGGVPPSTDAQEDERIHRALAERKRIFFEALEMLDEDQRAMMEYRYDITDGNLGEIRTLDETAKKFGVSREKVYRTDQKLLRAAGVTRDGCIVLRRRIKLLRDYL